MKKNLLFEPNWFILDIFKYYSNSYQRTLFWGTILWLVILLSANGLSAQAFISHSGYFGGNDDTEAISMKVVNGETYFLGTTEATDYPVTDGSVLKMDANGPTDDYVVTKLDVNGNIVYSTYLGSSEDEDNDYATIAVENGEVYILGLTSGDDYPVLNGLPYNGGEDAVLTKLDVNGNIVYSTYLGRTDRPDADEVPSVLRVENGMAYVTGITDPGGSGPGSSNDVFLFKINPDGSIAYLKLIGGDQDITSGGTIRDGRGDEDEVSMAISNGEVYLFGLTNAVDFPVTDGSSLASRDDDFFIMKLDNAGNTVYASYLGGSEDEDHLFINTTPPLQVVNGELYVFGLSQSIDFPTPNGNSIPTDDSYFVVAKFDAAGNQVFGTSFGTSEGSIFPGSYIVQDGVIYIANRISGDATGYPVTDGIPAPTNGDNLVVTKLDANTGSLLFSSFIFGGQNNDNPGPADLQVEDGYMYVYGVVDENPLPTTNGSTPNGDNDVFIVKLDPSGKIVYSSYIGGSEEERYGIDDKYADVSQLQVENGNIYFITETESNDYPVTNSSTITDDNRTIAITKLSFCSGYTPPPLTVTPATQTVCQFGLAAEIEAPPIVVPGGDLPTVFRNGAISEQDGIQVKYQWQSADDPNGPWTDIPAGILPGYLASVGGTDQYYRRKAYVPCCDVEYISEVAAILVNDNIAPEVSGDPVRFTCPDEPVTIGGSPTATEGSSPIASYLWDMDGFLDNAASPNPIATVMDQTIFTVTVTDQNGCQQIGQTVVLPVVADAGPDVDACEGIGVRIGTLPPPGLTGVTYSWTTLSGDGVATSLSCSDCAQPIATPTTVTTYEVSLTIPLFGGESCITTDEVTVSPVLPPRDNFAGEDMIICLGETTELGTPQEDGFSYTWAPGNYLRRNDRAEVTFEAGNLSLPVPNPITYFVTAEKAGCTFVDQVQVSVIEADADIDGCGPRTIGTPDRTPNLNETYSWELVSGPGGFTGPTDVPVTSVSASVGGTSIYRLTVTLDGVECVDEVEVPDCGCQVDIEVSDPNNCPSFFTNGGDPITLTASAVPALGDPDAFIYNWSPAAGLSTTVGRTVELTDNINRTYTVTMTSPFDPNFGCSQTIEVNNPAWSLPVFEAQDGDICELNPTPVAIGQPVVAEYAYAWTGPNGFTSDMSNPSVTEAGAYTVTVTDIGSGCTVEDVATVNEVVVVADAGPDWEVCDNAIIQLGTPDLGLGYTYMWDPENSPWQNGTDETFDQPEVLITTDLTFTVTVTDPVTGCFSTDEVMVTVNNTPSLDPQPDATLCVGSNPVQIGGYPELPGVTYSWMPTNDLSCTDCPNPMASPDATTVYTVTATYPGQCQAAITDQITVNVEDISFDLGMDITYCPSDGPVNIGANAPMSGFTYSWDPRTDLSNRFIANPTASPSVPTTYSLRIRQSAAPFCTFTDDITVTPSQLPPDAGTDKTICLEGSTVLGNPNNTGTLVWSGPAAGDLSCTECSTPTFTPTSAGEFTFTLTRTVDGCTTTDEITVFVQELVLPAFPTSEAICQGACIEIGPQPEFGVSYVWSPQAGLDDPFSARTLACPGGPTTYTLTATNSLGCVATSSVTVSFSEETAPQVSIPEETICVGSSVMLSPEVLPGSGDYDYIWSPIAGLDNPNVENPTVFGSVLGTNNYSLLVVDNTTGCQTTAQAEVEVVGADIIEPVISQTDCYVDEVQLGATIEGDVGAFLWLTDGDGSFSPSDDVIDPVYIPGPNDQLSRSVQITLEAYGANCGNVKSTSVRLVLCASLGDFVWEDLNGDGLQDAGEPGIEGVEVSLLNANGDVIATTTTDENGFYEFTGLIPGEVYQVRFGEPGGFTEVTTFNAGSDPALDSDADPDNNLTSGPVVLASGENNPTIDAGFLICRELPRADAGPDQRLCGPVLRYLLAGSSIGGGASEGTWTIESQPVNGDGQITNPGPDADPSDAVFTATVSGNYVLRLTTDDPQGPCPAVFDELTITVCREVEVICDDVNITIPSCQNTVDAIITFTITDRTNGVDPNEIELIGAGVFAGIDLQANQQGGGEPGRQQFWITRQGDGGVFFRDLGPTNPQNDYIAVIYKGARENLCDINIVQGTDIDVAISAPELNVTIPACQDEMAVLASFTLYDCEGTPDFGDFTITGFGVFAGQVFTGFGDAAIGPNQATFYVSNTASPYLVTPVTDGGGEDAIVISYKGTDAVLRVNAQKGSDIDRVVVAPDINLTVPSCADRIPFLAEFTAVDCEGAPDFSDFTVTGFGQFAGRTFAANVRNVAQGPNQQEYYVTEGPGVPGAILTAVPSANPLADGFVVEYKDIVTVIRVNAVADPDIDQAVIPAEGTFTIPACEDDITVIPDFTLLDCGPDGSPVTVTGFGQFAGRTFFASLSSGTPTQATWGIFEAGNPNGVTMRPTTNGPGGDGFAITYKGITAPYFMTVIEGNEKRVGPTIDEPGQNRWFIPECEVCTEVNAFFTGIDNCDGAVTPDLVSIEEMSGPTPGTANPIRTLAASEFVTVVDDNGERHVRILCAAPGFYRITMSATDSDRNTTTTTFELEVEALGLPDLDNLSCNDNVYVKLDDNCEKAITADMVLEGFVCDNEFTVVIDYGMGNKERDNISQCGTFKYEVFILEGDRMGESICWGYITAEDKTPPVVPTKVYVPVACGDLDIILANSERDKVRKLGSGDECVFPMFGNAGFYTSWDLIKDKAYFNINTDVFDACSDYCDLKFQINDLKMEGDICAEDAADRPMVVRTVKVTDEKGNSAAFEIWFYENQPEFVPGCKDVNGDAGHEGFYLYEDISCYMNTEIDLCLGDHAVKGSFYYYSCWYDVVDGQLVQREVRPSFTATDNGGTASFCGYAATYVDVKIPIEDDCGYKITRSWTLLDWCVEDPFRKIFEKDQLIKKGYFSPLEVTPPAIGDKDGYVSTGAFDCTASWVFGAPSIVACDDGSGFEYSIKIYSEVEILDKFGVPTGETEYVLANVPLRNTSGGIVASELPVGKHKVVYGASTDCQVGEAEAHFEVKDLTAPVAICDDELNISVGGSGIARVTVQDVDEGSWDNCQLESLELRRKLDDCLDAYLSEVLGVSSLDDLQSEEFTNAHGEKGTRWFRYMDTQKMILISQEPGQDGGTLHYYSWWAQEVYFTCCDIATSLDDFVVLELKAVDKAGNKNICWMDVMVESKQVATCWAPADIAIACTDLNFDPADYDQVVAALGAAADLVTVDFNCAAVLSDTISWAPADCSEGVLTRIFTVTTTTSKGVVERTCEQKIEIYNVNDYLIKFPADASDVCEGDGGDDLELTTYACDVFAVNRDTAIFDASGDACFKRYVTYRVINWCEYDGVSLEPTIVPRDVDCDGNLEEMTWVRVEGEPKWNADTPTNTVWIDDDANPKNEPVITFPRTANSYRSLACDGNKEYWITPGYWEYTQVVKVYDDEAPELTVTTDDLSFCANGATGAADCNGEVMILFEVEDLCTGTNVEVRSVLLSPFNSGPADLTGELYNVEGDNGSYMITSIPGVGLPVGNHTFYVRVADDCGNITNRLIEFSVEDCKTPAPICISILSVDLMPVVENKVVVGGMNEVWATDFLASGQIDCTPHPKADAIPGSDNNVRYYAVRQDALTADELAGLTADDLTDDFRSVFFDCDDNGAAVSVFVIGVDGAGNWDYCTVMVNVQPGADPCAQVGDPVERVAVAGLISTAEGNAVEGVNVNLSGQLSNTLTTGEGGDYMFGDLQSGYDYTITPSHDANAMNGVSTFDLVLISKHILGVEALDSPYKLLAADVNNSQSVTTLDLIQIRKLILSIDTEFSNKSSWTFVRKDYVFPDPSNPWAEQTPSIINMNNLEEDYLTGDFVAIKNGDVNGSAIANSRMAAPRNVVGMFNVRTQDVAMKTGNEYTLSFTADELAQIQGYQFTLNFDNSVLELVDINYGVAKEDNFGLTHLNEGVITTSWNKMSGSQRLPQTLFSMVVRAKSDAMLSELMSIGSRYTNAEAYGASGEQLDVALSFGDDAVANAGFELYQNTPNPFVGETQIGFNLPEASDVTITINDVTGKTLKVIRGEFAKGYNNVNVNDLPSGVMYYTLESGDFTATLKMINIK